MNSWSFITNSSRKMLPITNSSRTEREAITWQCPILYINYEKNLIYVKINFYQNFGLWRPSCLDITFFSSRKKINAWQNRDPIRDVLFRVILSWCLAWLKPLVTHVFSCGHVETPVRWLMLLLTYQDILKILVMTIHLLLCFWKNDPSTSKILFLQYSNCNPW